MNDTTNDSELHVSPTLFAEPAGMAPAIAAGIVEAMAMIGSVEKTGKNKDQGYKYVEFGVALGEIQPAMAKAGIFVLQSEQEIKWIAEGDFVAIVYRFIIGHSSGALYEHPLHQTGMARFKFKSGGYDDKAYNKCHSQARKYFLMALFQIPVEDEQDPDHRGDQRDERHDNAGGGGSGKPAPASTVQRASDAKNWARAATSAIQAFTKLDELRAWKAKWDAALARLEKVDPDEHTKLSNLLHDTLEKLAGRGEPEKPDEVPF